MQMSSQMVWIEVTVLKTLSKSRVFVSSLSFDFTRKKENTSQPNHSPLVIPFDFNNSWGWAKWQYTTAVVSSHTLKTLNKSKLASESSFCGISQIASEENDGCRHYKSNTVLHEWLIKLEHNRRSLPTNRNRSLKGPWYSPSVSDELAGIQRLPSYLHQILADVE